MEIILIQDVDTLGQKDDVVIVKDGYARNFLIPKKLAIKATESAKKIVSENKKQRVFKEAKTKNEALAIAAKLETIKITIGAKTSTTGKIFGSVNTIMLAEAINKNGFEIDRKQIALAEDHIKEVGTFTAKIKLYKDVIIDFEFEVVAE
jgi:large subunit ribosomal protein L9